MATREVHGIIVEQARYRVYASRRDDVQVVGSKKVRRLTPGELAEFREEVQLVIDGSPKKITLEER